MINQVSLRNPNPIGSQSTLAKNRFLLTNEMHAVSSTYPIINQLAESTFKEEPDRAIFPRAKNLFK